MTNNKKVERLIEVGYVTGNLTDDSDLLHWCKAGNYSEDESKLDDMLVEYYFSEECVSYVVAEDDDISSTSTCTEDEWENFSEKELDRLISLIS